MLDKQNTFAVGIAHLILRAESQGYQVTFGEAYRTPEQAAWNAAKGIGISNSLHTLRLAIDLNLFKDGVYLTDTASYVEIGKYWRSLNSEFRWGGDFRNSDGNHFSMENEGVQ